MVSEVGKAILLLVSVVYLNYRRGFREMYGCLRLNMGFPPLGNVIAFSFFEEDAKTEKGIFMVF